MASADRHRRGRGMDVHQLDIAVSDADESWCSCTCGWVSPKSAIDEAQRMLTTHVVESAFNSTTSV